MYYIAYESGRKVRDGHAATVGTALATVDGTWVFAGSLGDEYKYVDADRPGTALYIRPDRAGINVDQWEDSTPRDDD